MSQRLKSTEKGSLHGPDVLAHNMGGEGRGGKMASATRPLGPRPGHLPTHTNNPPRAGPLRLALSCQQRLPSLPALAKVSTEAQRRERHRRGSPGCSPDAAADAQPAARVSGPVKALLAAGRAER